MAEIEIVILERNALPHRLPDEVTGFIGSHLAERLLEDGQEVVGVDAFTEYDARPLKQGNLPSSSSQPPRSGPRLHDL